MTIGPPPARQSLRRKSNEPWNLVFRNVLPGTLFSVHARMRKNIEKEACDADLSHGSNRGFPVRLLVRRTDPAGVVLSGHSGGLSRPKELKR